MPWSIQMYQIVLIDFLLGTMMVPSAQAAAAILLTGTALVVDRDRAQCADAGFTSIQSAVDAARPGDQIVVCPDRYNESVVINKRLTITGDPDAIAAIDCFQTSPSQLGDLDPSRYVSVDPA